VDGPFWPICLGTPLAEWRLLANPERMHSWGDPENFWPRKDAWAQRRRKRKILCGGAGKAEGASGAARRVFARSGAKQLGL